MIERAKSFDSQETISEEKTETDFTSVMSKSKSEKGKRRIVRTSSDSEDFISPTILKSQSMCKSKKLKKMSKEILHSDFSLDLKTQGDTQPVFKSVWDTQISEKMLTRQGWVFSDNTSIAQSSTSSMDQERISAKDIKV